MSLSMSLKVFNWSAVGVYAKDCAKARKRSPSGLHGTRLASCRFAYILRRSAATSSTFFAALVLRRSHDLTARVESSFTGDNSSSSSCLRNSLSNERWLAGISSVRSLKATLRYCSRSASPLTMKGDEYTPSNRPTPKAVCTTKSPRRMRDGFICGSCSPVMGESRGAEPPASLPGALAGLRRVALKCVGVYADVATAPSCAAG
mmetsp:Transcript_46782/g.108679  ORF Transcript_46782/g.108679 Transcript_46782/m.108679 type:complete len:204 (-) Transcript_46782:204-815(-)